MEYAEIDRHALTPQQMNDDIKFGRFCGLRRGNHRHQQFLRKVNGLRCFARIRTGDNGDVILRVCPGNQSPSIGHHWRSRTDKNGKRFFCGVTQREFQRGGGGLIDAPRFVQVFEFLRDDLNVADNPNGGQPALQPVQKEPMARRGIADDIHELLGQVTG